MGSTQQSSRRFVLLAVMAVIAGSLSMSWPAQAEQSESAALVVPAASLATGRHHTCALLTTGDVRCWGLGALGRLGYGNTDDVGATNTPASVGNVPLGAKATAISAGANHTCALLTTGNVRCWGSGGQGRLGYGNTDNIGATNTAAEVGDVPLGGKATAITAGGAHTCAVLTTGDVRCWGNGIEGQLGYGNTNSIGATNTPADVGDVPLGAKATAISAGTDHTCALLTTGNVRCWGYGGLGQLGYGNTNYVGAADTPASAGNVPLGATAIGITAGDAHTCALLSTGNVRCWGSGGQGRLGYGNTSTIGATNTPASAGNVPLGATAIGITAGTDHTCALLTTGIVRCWGRGDEGQLGYGNTDTIGATNTPASAGNVPLAAPSTAITAGGAHTCASRSDGRLHCWGLGVYGRLGYGDTANRGDTTATTPDKIAPVPVGGLVRTRATLTLTLATPKRAKKAPYRFSTAGTLAGSFPRTAATCTGTVELQARYKKKRLARTTVLVRSDCTYRGVLTVTRKRLTKALPRRLVAPKSKEKRRAATAKQRKRWRTPVKVVVTAAFSGNANLTPATRSATTRAR